MSTSPLRLDIVLPVYNEEETLNASVLALHSMMTAEFQALTWQITIADNASTDSTAAIADSLTAVLPNLRCLHLPAKGRGRALKAAWLSSMADVVAYMDIDLSTDLRALAPLVAPLLNGHSDLAIGSRLAHGSRVVRGTKREVLSRGYNHLLHASLGVSFSDAQCGFKAMTAQSAKSLLPVIADDEWFFDTELLVMAEHSGLRIAEVAVDWFEDPHSTVDVPTTVRSDLLGIGRLGWSLARGNPAIARVHAEIGRRPLEQAPPLSAQLTRFALVGIASTALYSLLFLIFHVLMGPQWANFTALLISGVANIIVNRRLTFGLRDVSTVGIHLFQGLLVFLATWALTSGALLVASSLSPGLSSWDALIILTVANAVATVLRFVVFRFIFRPADDGGRTVDTDISRRELLGA